MKTSLIDMLHTSS